MQKFYEIHDSLLESLDQEGERVSIRLRAVLTETENANAPAPNHFRQEIRLVLDGAQLTIDSPNLPSWLLEGAFRCETSDAEKTDGGAEETIPASLRSAKSVELVLAGLHEGSGDFVTISVKANSLALEQLGEPQSLQHTRASI
ncbi:MAG: hypothetical protein P4M04_01515 [Acidobacteriota bacterium]|nr:hypothetical protein [Acidobacteriota bacterium]